MSKNELEIKVEVKKANMEAWIYINGPKLRKLTFDSIKFYIDQEKIVYGIKTDIIHKLVEEFNNDPRTIVNLEAIIALGQNVIETINGTIEIMIPPIEKVNITKDGNADFRNIKIFREVKTGQLLAKFKQPILGTRGYNVYGEMILPAEPIIEELNAAKNVHFNDVTGEYTALCNGIFEENKTSIQVNPVLTIAENIGIATGNIEYSGDMYISGIIERNSVVKAKGDVEVIGTIESGNITVAKNLTASSGINTKKEGTIKVYGNIKANYIENSDILCHQDMIVDNSIVNSTITTYKKLELTGKNSSIVGGEIIAYDSIRVANLGSRNETPTRIRIGIHQFYYTESKKLKNELDNVKEEFLFKLDEVKNLKEYVARMKDKMSPQQMANIKIKFDTYKNLLMKKEQMEKKLELYKKHIYNPNPLKLIIHQNLYPGVEIYYMDAVKKVDQTNAALVINFMPNDPKKIQFGVYSS